MLTRRSFLTGLGAAVGIVAAEPVRRYWAVGAQLTRLDPMEATFAIIDRMTFPIGTFAAAGSADGMHYDVVTPDMNAYAKCVESRPSEGVFGSYTYSLDDATITINGQEYKVTDGVMQRNRSSFSEPFKTPAVGRTDTYKYVNGWVLV